MGPCDFCTVFFSIEFCVENGIVTFQIQVVDFYSGIKMKFPALFQCDIFSGTIFENNNFFDFALVGDFDRQEIRRNIQQVAAFVEQNLVESRFDV